MFTYDVILTQLRSSRIKSCERQHHFKKGELKATAVCLTSRSYQYVSKRRLSWTWWIK